MDEIAVAFSKGQHVKLYSGPLEAYGVAVHDIPEASDEAPREKSSKSKGSSAKAYSYLSQVGTSVKRHTTWAACERRVKGVSGARYKKTTSAEDEARVLKDWGTSSEDVKAED